MMGRIHSFETFGTVDGPGIRFVLFMQGCPLRCRYCHNPDTWLPGAGRLATVDEVLAEVEPYLTYYRTSGGGITVSGGEPAVQASFVGRLFAACKMNWDLHTALDTSGFCDPAHVRALMDVTDLVLLDLKLMDREGHIALTGQPNDRILTFARWLARIGKPIWIRRVIVPGLTDGRDDLVALGRFVAELGNVQKVELLPYHRMGVPKWTRLGWPYDLEHVPEATQDDIKRARAWLEEGMDGKSARCADG